MMHPLPVASIERMVAPLWDVDALTSELCKGGGALERRNSSLALGLSAVIRALRCISSRIFDDISCARVFVLVPVFQDVGVLVLVRGLGFRAPHLEVSSMSSTSTS